MLPPQSSTWIHASMIFPVLSGCVQFHQTEHNLISQVNFKVKILVLIHFQDEDFVGFYMREICLSLVNNLQLMHAHIQKIIHLLTGLGFLTILKILHPRKYCNFTQLLAKHTKSLHPSFTVYSCFMNIHGKAARQMTS